MNSITKLVIAGEKHAAYERTVDLAEKYFAYAENSDVMKEMIKSLRSTENEQQKKDRLRVSIFRTGGIIAKTETQFKRNFRMDKEAFAITRGGDKPDEAHTEIIDKTSNFGENGESLLEDVENKSLLYNKIDPNAIEWVKYDPQDELFEPIMFPSKDCLYYKKKKGLIVQAVLQNVAVAQGMDSGERYSLNITRYFTFEGENLNITVKYVERADQVTDFYNQLAESAVEITEEVIGSYTYRNYTYAFEYESIPLFQYGYIPDVKTGGMSFVSWYHDAISVLKETVYTGSMKDITMFGHTFPKLVQFYQPCDYVDHATGSMCVSGQMNISKSNCPSCKGTGKKMHDSGLDVIEVAIPDGKEELMVKPSDYADYITIPIDGLNAQVNELEKLPVKFSEAIFGVDLSNRPNNETATANQNYYDTAYDVLFEFTKSPTYAFKIAIRFIAEAMGIEPQNYDVRLVYSNDYNLDTLHQLLMQRKAAIEAGATPETLQEIDDKILKKVHRDDSMEVKKQQAFRQFLPFKSISEEMRNKQIDSLPNSDYNKVLYLNFDQITTDIMESNPNFLVLDYDKQKAIIETATQPYIDKQSVVVDSFTSVNRDELEETE